MSDWFGDDHSPVGPILTPNDLRQIHKDGYHYRPSAINDKDETFRFVVESELDFIASFFGKNWNDDAVLKIVKGFRMVRGTVPLKVAVALYSLNLCDQATLVKYLKLRGIEMSTGDLFHYAYRFGLGKVRKPVMFEEILSAEPAAKDIRPEHLRLVRERFESFLKELQKDPQFMGRRPESIARAALLSAMESVGYEI